MLYNSHSHLSRNVKGSCFENSLKIHGLHSRSFFLTDDGADLFPRELADSLEVSPQVISKMMKLNEMQALRKRAKILTKLEECKNRIIGALQSGKEKVKILFVTAFSFHFL